jgi:hypothetical protein
MSNDTELLRRYVEECAESPFTDLGLKFIDIRDEQGKSLAASGNWGQYGFRKHLWPTKSDPVIVSFAVVPNVHTIFYAQPRLQSELYPRSETFLK